MLQKKKAQKGFRGYSFTEWQRWDQRNRFSEIKNPGIYVIAKSKKSLSNINFGWQKDIIYIGMTASKGGLRARLNQFNDTILRKAINHGGASRVLHHYKKNCNSIIPHLYVAIMTQSPCLKKKDKDAVYGLELFCLAEYISRHKKIPQFNDWSQSPKIKED